MTALSPEQIEAEAQRRAMRRAQERIINARADEILSGEPLQKLDDAVEPFDDVPLSVGRLCGVARSIRRLADELIHLVDGHEDSPSVGACGPESRGAFEPIVGDAPGAGSFPVQGATSGEAHLRQSGPRAYALVRKLSDDFGELRRSHERFEANLREVRRDLGRVAALMSDGTPSVGESAASPSEVAQ